MILSSLVRFYETLIERGILERSWTFARVGYALVIDKNGNLKNIISLKEQKETVNKKTGKIKVNLVPRRMKVPLRAGRSGKNPPPYYLCDKSSYFLGLTGKKGNLTRKDEYFLAAKEYHNKLLPATSAAAEAVRNYFEKWDIDKAESTVRSLVSADIADELFNNDNLVFLYEDDIGKFVLDDEDIKKTWLDHYQSGLVGEQFCSTTGKISALAKTHPQFNVIGAQSSGAAIVSFNNKSFESYGKEQGANAPTGQYAADAYGEALKYLLSDTKRCRYIGDTATGRATAMIFYSISGETEYQDIGLEMLFGYGVDEPKYSEEELLGIVKNICDGKPVVYNDTLLDPKMEFYLLGLSPNNARLAVEFFEKSTFGEFINNVMEHQKRLDIRTDRKSSLISIKQILRTMYMDDKDVVPSVTSALIKAIIWNTRYPAAVIYMIASRIRAGMQVNHTTAAIIKAYYMKNTSRFVPKELLVNDKGENMGLNKETENIPYNLGRLFAILERIQKTANTDYTKKIDKDGNVYTYDGTVKNKDRYVTRNNNSSITMYFAQASTNPSAIFPMLIGRAQYHLEEMSPGYMNYWNNMLGQVLDKFDMSFPKTLNMDEQGAFQLGYYHQSQDFRRWASSSDEADCEEDEDDFRDDDDE